MDFEVKSIEGSKMSTPQYVHYLYIDEYNWYIKKSNMYLCIRKYFWNLDCLKISYLASFYSTK